MPPTPVEFPSFTKGLDLTPQVTLVDPAAAINCLNVTFSPHGSLRMRDGYGTFTATPGTNRYDSMIPYYTTSGTTQLVVGAGNRLEGLSSAGAVVASSTAPTANPHFFTRFGGPTTEVVYAANGTDSVRQWNGSAWSVPAWTGTTPTGKFVAVTPWDNRLACARYSGSTGGSNQSSVRFSDLANPAGTPSTTQLNFPTNNYVDLTPGDGEQIMGMIAWGDYLFVFKESKFFVFNGTTADSSGNPVFQYRTVDSGVGLAASKGLCIGPDGVYFFTKRGIFRTSGGAPVLLSDKLDPLWYGGLSAYYGNTVINPSAMTAPAMAWHEERLYVSVPSSGTTNDYTLVWDRKEGWWTIFSFKAAALASFRVSGRAELVFALADSGSPKDIVRTSDAYTDDAGEPISATWYGGFSNYGSSNMKTIRELKVWGTGELTGIGFVPFTNAGSPTVPAVFTGTDLVKGKLVRKAARGTYFSLWVFGDTFNGGPFSVDAVTAHVRSRRTPSIVRGTDA